MKRGVCLIYRNANQVCHTVFVPWVKVQILLQWDQSRVFEVRDLQKYSRIEINTVNEIFRESCCKVISHSPKLLDIVPLCPRVSLEVGFDNASSVRCCLRVANGPSLIIVARTSFVSALCLERCPCGEDDLKALQDRHSFHHECRSIKALCI